MNALFNENDQFPALNDLSEPITHIQTVKLRIDVVQLGPKPKPKALAKSRTLKSLATPPPPPTHHQNFLEGSRLSRRPRFGMYALY